jgi:RND family efflux transporter MFP subunit
MLAQKAPPPIKEKPGKPSKGKPADEPPPPTPEPEPLDFEVESIEATIINPYRSANVGAEVGGIIDEIHFQEGEFMERGAAVVEISRERYEVQLEKAREIVKGMELAHKRARQDAKLKEELLASDAITRQEALQAKTEVEIAATRLEEAKKELELAKLNLEDCVVEAPFPGYMAVRYKQPHEPVERLEKIFAIVDSAKVYAVANIAEDLLNMFPIGATATFEDTSGRRFTGKVAKVGKLIDPKSKTKRVYVLIDNSAGELEVGMTGSLQAK